MPSPGRTVAPSRILIEDVRPTIDGGRFPAKHMVATALEVSATVIRDGHEVLRVAAVLDARGGTSHEMVLGLASEPDRFAGTIVPRDLGPQRFRVVAWVDRWASWCEEMGRKLAAGCGDLAPERSEGRAILSELGTRLGPGRAGRVERAATLLAGGSDVPVFDAALAEDLAAEPLARAELTETEWYPLDVDPRIATVGAWYELFPRSFGGLGGVRRVLPQLADLGFDVVYLPPIHPIGTTNRKGRNNATVAAEGDPGSPWAIGGPDGGHTAVHAELGTIDDVVALTAAASNLGMTVALDLALQCSPDHPWLVEHPEWFERRPDGTIKFAENPPKRYEDIHNLDFGTSDREGLWNAILDVVETWVSRGVRAFRVDNPHTKPLALWHWLIAEVRRGHPDVIFLAEAFTRPVPMRALAKVGFSQSYTYFTWKNTREELVEFIALIREWRDCYRPNLFTNTPDILHEYLQDGGPPAFVARLVLAATIGPSYGIYSGFEAFENVAVRAGSEEYLDSEKYELKERALDGPLLPLVARLNAIRRAHPVVTQLEDVTILDAGNPSLMCFAKGRGTGAIIVCVNLDPHAAQRGACHVPDWLLPSPRARVRDLLTEGVWEWGSGANFVELDPAQRQAHVFVVEGP